MLFEHNCYYYKMAKVRKYRTQTQNIILRIPHPPKKPQTNKTTHKRKTGEFKETILPAPNAIAVDNNNSPILI